jgi:hypothetical protein
VRFTVRVRNVAWADEWLDDGFDPSVTVPKTPQDMEVDIWLDGKVYGTTVTGTYTSKAEKNAKLRK